MSEEILKDNEKDRIESKDTIKNQELMDDISRNEETGYEVKGEEEGILENVKEKKLEEILLEKDDLILRLNAEIINTTKRLGHEISRVEKFAIKNFIVDLLPIIDGFENVTESLKLHKNDKKIHSTIDGANLLLNLIDELMKKHEIKSINPINSEFNPLFHEAMSVEDNKEFKSNLVTKVFQKGYLLKGRLIRPALVCVAK